MLKHLADLSEKKLEAHKTFIDRVITVSTGALALSVTFRSAIAGAGVRHVWLLQSAWLGLVVCSVGGVVMHLTTASTCKRLVAAMQKDEHAVAAGPHPFYQILWIIILFCFPLSFAALSIFAIVNVN